MGDTNGESVAAARGVCPECGAAMGTPPSKVRSRIVAVCAWLPWIGVLAVVGVVVGGALWAQSTGVLGFSLSWHPVGEIRQADLAAIATGEKRGDEFLPEVDRQIQMRRPWAMGPEDVDAGWMPPAGTRYELTAWGWPWGWVERERQGQYEDVFNKTGPVERDWGVMRHSFWTGTWHSSASSGPVAAEVEYYNSTLAGLASLALLVIGGWYAGPLVCGLIARVRRGRAVRGRRAAACGALFVLIMCGVGGLVFPSKYTYFQLGPTQAAPAGGRSTPSQAVKTGWTVQDFRDAAEKPDAVRLIAQKLASVLPEPAEGGSVVVLGAEPLAGRRARATYVGWPSQWLFWDMETGGAPVSRGRGKLEFGWRAAGIAYWPGTGPLDGVTVRLDWLAVFALAGFVVWKALRAVSALVGWRLIRGRKERGLCMGCGYDLAGLQGVAGGSPPLP